MDNCVTCTFLEGFYIKNLFEHIKNNNIDGMFKFTPNGLEYSQTNARNTIVNHLICTPNKRFIYKFEGKKPIYFPLKLANLKNATKTTPKDGIIELYIPKNDRCMHVKIYSQLGYAALNESIIYSLDVGEFTPKIIKAPVYKDTCNCEEAANLLSNYPNQLSNNRCNYVVFRCYNKGLEMVGITEGSKNKSVCIAGTKFIKEKVGGIVLNIEDKPFLELKIDILDFKVFSKLYNLTDKPVKLYMEPNKPIKCVITNNDYAYYAIYLSEYNE